jgi:hypothetical protein
MKFVVAFNRSKSLEEICKIAIEIASSAVRIDVLTEESDILVALGDKTAHLGFYCIRMAASLASANVGNNAVGAEIIAAVHYADPRAVVALADYGNILDHGRSVLGDNEGSLCPRQTAVKQLGEHIKIGRSKSKVNVRIFMLDLVCTMLL